MVKRRCIALLLIGLALVAGTLYLKLDVVARSEAGSFYQSHIFTSTYLRQLWALQVAEPPVQTNTTPDPNRNCSGGILMYGKYCVCSPYQNEVRNTSKVGSVTLCTQGTVEFLQHVVVLCRRWSAPVSVAVYSPKEDYVDAHRMVQLLRHCNPCVRYWVDWHFFYPEHTELPPVEQLQLSGNCSSITQKKSKKRRSKGIYPINVGRNVARRLAATPFVFSIDIELYPSLDIPAKFERMLQSQAPNTTDNQVWVFPVFEVHSTVRVPFLKSELRKLFMMKAAVSFHRFRCYTCHKIPNVTQWITHPEARISEVQESLEPLRIWSTVKRNRHYKLKDWEPFFIGTNKDPEFDIRLSWEGKINKMQMAYEMCMRDYDFHIVENAFLVHSPGINVYNASSEKFRMKYTVENNKVFNTVKQALILKYGNDRGC